MDHALIALFAGAALASLFMAWVIGAGSSGATSYAPAVGTNAIVTMRAALLVGIFGFAGAVTQGGNVSEAVGSGLVGGIRVPTEPRSIRDCGDRNYPRRSLNCRMEYVTVQDAGVFAEGNRGPSRQRGRGHAGTTRRERCERGRRPAWLGIPCERGRRDSMSWRRGHVGPLCHVADAAQFVLEGGVGGGHAVVKI